MQATDFRAICVPRADYSANPSQPDPHRHATAGRHFILGQPRPAAAGRLASTLGVMKTHRENLIETAAADSEMPTEFARLLLDAALWLDGTEEVSEELGPELLADEASSLNVSRRKLQEFLERYNTLVQSYSNPHALRQSEAHLAMESALQPYGRANAFGEGDYWLVSDSFSGRTPVLLVFENFRFPPAAISTLQKLLNQFNGVFSELRINTEFGAEIITLRPE